MLLRTNFVNFVDFGY